MGLYMYVFGLFHRHGLSHARTLCIKLMQLSLSTWVETVKN